MVYCRNPTICTPWCNPIHLVLIHTLCFISSREPTYGRTTFYTPYTHHAGSIFQHLATKVYTILLLCQLVQYFIAQAPAKRLSNGIHQTVTEKDRERNKPTVLGATIPAGQSGGCYYRGGATVKCWIRSAPVTFRRPSRDVRDEGELVRVSLCCTLQWCKSSHESGSVNVDGTECGRT